MEGHHDGKSCWCDCGSYAKEDWPDSDAKRALDELGYIDDELSLTDVKEASDGSESS